MKSSEEWWARWWANVLRLFFERRDSRNESALRHVGQTTERRRGAALKPMHQLMLALPYTTFDEIAALGLEVEVECRRCHHRAPADLSSHQLRGKSFVDVRFRCHQLIQPWSAEPARRCNSLGHLHIKPPADKAIQPGQGILHAYVACGNCVPSWSIDQARRHDPLWKPIWDQESPRNRLGCPGCGRELITAWSGDGVDSWKRTITDAA